MSDGGGITLTYAEEYAIVRVLDRAAGRLAFYAPEYQGGLALLGYRLGSDDEPPPPGLLAPLRTGSVREVIEDIIAARVAQAVEGYSSGQQRERAGTTARGGRDEVPEG